MEWVETTGKTIEEAKDRALDLLGVDERDAEFEVVEEPKVGFLGRVKSMARVRARVRPAAPRPKLERRDRRRGGERGGRGGRGRGREAGDAGTTEAEPAVESEDATRSDAAAPADTEGAVTDEIDRADAGAPARRRRRRGSGSRSGARPAGATDGEVDEITGNKGTAMPDLSLDEQGRLVASFLDGLVEAFGLEASTTWEQVDDESVEVRVDGTGLGLLVGPKGRTLQAVTEVARSIVVRHGEGASSGRVHIDVAGYRQRRREALQRFTHEVSAQVLESGTARALEPMSPADRKIVHDTVNEIDGVVSTSEGEEPSRRVVINPA